MFGLIYKDIIANKKIIKIMLIGLFLIILVMNSAVSGYADVGEKNMMSYFIPVMCGHICIYVIMGCIQQEVIKRDERKLWAYYITSTPDGVKQQVGSKYLFVLLTTVIGFSLCMVLDYVTSLTFGIMPEMFMSLYMLMMYAVILINAVEIPFVIRFGNKAGNNYRSIVFVIVVFAVLVYALFGDIAAFSSSEKFMEMISSLLSGEVKSAGLAIVIAAFPYIAGVLFFFSYKLSCKLYLKGTECYNG